MKIVDLILGRPLASNEQESVKVGIWAAIPAMGLDALGSSAYGPEAALTILIPLGAGGLNSIGPITIIIVALLAMLYVSYRQTIGAYPANGGSYTVARENLGVRAGLLAAAALILDYLLNVAVGISAGVAALVSAAPALQKFILPLCLGILLIITLMNLRGTGEAGLAFALPTYTFIVAMLIVLTVGVVKAVRSGGHPTPMIALPQLPQAVETISIWLFLRALASGCTAMTGVEAISNGVAAFREPNVDRARRTLTIIVLLLALLLAGISYLARAYHIGAMDQQQPGYQSILSQIIGAVFGRGWIYCISIGSILSVLCLSANTSFVGFPRLCRLLARDGFLPSAFAEVGRRLVYSVGIISLAIGAGTLLMIFGGVTDRLIPLFAVGAFLAFSLSQAGMVFHWKRQIASKDQKHQSDVHAQGRLWINGIGASATIIVLGIIIAAKFTQGAWFTVVAIPCLVILFHLIHRHYENVAAQTHATGPLDLSHNRPPIVLMPIKRWDRVAEKALRFAMWLSTEVIALHLNNLSGEEAAEEDHRVRKEWEANVEEPARRHQVPVPRLVFAQAPYRSFLCPILRKIDQLETEFPGRLIAVLLPEVMETHWLQLLLHRHKHARLRVALLQRGDWRVVVVEMPWYVER